MSHNIFIDNLKFLVDIILKSITMRLEKFGSEVDCKSRNWFFTLLNVYVFSKIQVFYRPKWTKEGTP